MPLPRRDTTVYSSAAKLLYLLVIALSFYFLYLSRLDEVYTIWGVIHSAFMPTFIVATLLLLAIIFSAVRVEYKVSFTILHSILSHVLMVVVFPAGNVGVQQTMLGKTRLVFDNVISNGFGWSGTSIPLKIYILFRGENLQTAFSVIFARMFGVDVYWTHLLLVPLLWGIFVPIAAFMISKTLGASERVSVLSGLVVSLFPTSIIWGYASIPNGLSYLFFFGFICFLLKYLKSSKAKDLVLVVIFLAASTLSHYLAGTIALSLLILAYSVKTYINEKERSHTSAKLTLLISFIFCVSILPFALANRRFFYLWADTRFSLQTFYELPPSATFFSILLGNNFDLISREAYITTLIFGVAPLVGLIGMIYVIITSSRRSSKRSIDPCVLLLTLGVALIAINDRILKLFMTNVPFVEYDRLWVFRDFLLFSFTTFFIVGALSQMRAFFDRTSKNVFLRFRKTSSPSKFSKAFSFLTRGHLAKGVSLGSIFAYVLILTVVSGWVTASVYYAYPHWAPLQTTSYELEAVKHIQETTKGKYIVVGDQWIIFAGQMFVGINNPEAFYFSHTDPRGVTLCIQMRTNPSNETLIEALKINNATVAYFIVEKPRLGTQEYNRIIQQAEQNGLRTYLDGIFYYKDEEKLRIFYYQSQSFK